MRSVMPPADDEELLVVVVLLGPEAAAAAAAKGCMNRWYPARLRETFMQADFPLKQASGSLKPKMASAP